MMIQRSAVLLFVFFSLYANGQEVTTEAIVDSSLWELVIPVEISSERKKIGNIVSLSRKDFITMPASFDDPSRLLINYAGFANSNDQNNGIVYHGMPSHFSGWLVNGAEIINPNHLATAGINQNQIAAGSGGVNAFSGQVIGDYKYRGTPDIYQQSNYLAGVSDMRLRTPYKNQITLNASLIGMEIGSDHKDGNFSSMINYRYSTVGLLTQAGLDFGGEEIIYQDAIIKLQHDSLAGGTGAIYALYGANSNFKPMTDVPISEITSLEQFESQDLNAKVLVTGMSFKKEVGNILFESAINYSHNLTEGIVVFMYDVFDEKKMLSFNSTLTYSTDKNQIEISLNGSGYHFDYTPSFGGQIITDQRSIIQESIVYKYNPSRRLYFTMGLFTPTYRHADSSSFHLFPKLGMTWINSSYRFQIDTKYSQNKQFYNIPNGAPLFPFTPPTLTPESHNFSIDFTDQKTGIKVQLFYHYIDQLIKSSNPFSPFSSLEEPSFQNFNVFSQFTAESDAHIYGVSLSFTEKISKHSSFSGNINYIGGRQNMDMTIGRQNIPYSSNLSTNFHFTKAQLWVKNLDFQCGLHYRNGKYTPSNLNPNYSSRLPYFFRADARLNYHFRKNKNRFKSMLSLDIQNLTNRLNGSYYFYDSFQGKEILETQLGIIPVLSWRVVI